VQVVASFQSDQAPSIGHGAKLHASVASLSPAHPSAGVRQVLFFFIVPGPQLDEHAPVVSHPPHPATQAFVLQFSVVVVSPLQLTPSAGVRHDRVFVRVPVPHGLLQSPKAQSDHTSGVLTVAFDFVFLSASPVFALSFPNIEGNGMTVGITLYACSTHMAAIAAIDTAIIDTNTNTSVLIYYLLRLNGIGVAIKKIYE